MTIAIGSAPACIPPAKTAASGKLDDVTYEGDSAFGPSMRVKRFRMGNGLRVLLLVDRSAPVVAYHTWYRVGSRDEKPGKTGLAHLFEHLMFNETKNLEAGEFDRTLEENGAESNAATWLDWTMYHEALPAPKLSLAAKLEADRMANLVLRDKQVSSEKEVVANERRYRVDDDVEGAVNELLYSLAFTAHPYHWPTIGWMKDIEGFTTGDCASFYKTFYAPNNATVVIVGDVDEKNALEIVRQQYGALPPSQLPEKKFPAEPPQSGERRREVKKPTATQKIMLGYKSPAISSADHAPLSVLNEILFGGRSSRIYRSMVKTKELATDIRGWVGTFVDPALYEMYVTARGEHTCAELEAALFAELEAVRSKEIGVEELEKAKSRLELAFLQGMETASGKAEQIGFYDTTLGDPGAGFARLEAFRETTAADLQRVAKTYLVAEHRTLVRVLPDESAS